MKYLILISFLVIVGCDRGTKNTVQPAQDQIADTSKTVIPDELQEDSTGIKCSYCFSVKDLSSRESTDSFWNFSYNNNGNFSGYKDYDYHDFYIVSKHVKSNPGDTIGRDAWALVLGNQIINNQSNHLFKLCK